MKEIKFRCWYVDEMYRVESIDFKRKRIVLYAADTIDFKDSILMQFTGLYDNKKKEIYEGDICKVFLENSIKIMEVQWCKESNEWVFIDKYGERWHITNIPIEVIGNIYENEDLLK